MISNEYLLPLKIAFEENSDKAKALQMKNYMRGQYDYYGIASPERRMIFANHKKEFGPVNDKYLNEIVMQCWQAPEREYQYFAMEMLDKVKRNAKPEIIQLYEFMITEKSWWDTIDYIAVNLVGNLFSKYPELIAGKTGEWMNSGNMWLQRTCLIYQLKYKNRLDTQLLESFILQLKDSKQFFIRKAIGWILREYSKTNPEYVKHFVENNTLSGLSRLEALKWMSRKQIA